MNKTLIYVLVFAGVAVLAFLLYMVIARPAVTNVGAGGIVDQSPSNGWDALAAGFGVLPGIFGALSDNDSDE